MATNTNYEAKNTTKHQHLIFFNDIQLVKLATGYISIIGGTIPH